MLTQVRVGPAEIVIHQGDTFLVSALNGEMTDPHRHGFFARDTRLLSKYRLLISGLPWVLLTGVATEYNRAVHWYASPELNERTKHLDKSALQLKLQREIGNHLVDTFEITNFSKNAVSFHFGIEIISDFADLFDVRSEYIADRGDIDVKWDGDRRVLDTRYRNETFERGMRYEIDMSAAEPHYANGVLRFPIGLEPKQTWTATCRVVALIDRDGLPADCAAEARSGGSRGRDADEIERLQSGWQGAAPRLAPPDSELVKAYNQAVYDIGSLRLYQLDVGDTQFLPAAGVPWFVAVFGQDSIITALQSMMVSSKLARGTLHRLAQAQARERDDSRDAQPGKIVHEMRAGELAQLGIVPHAKYFGTADATALFLVLLSETWRWTADEALLRQHRDTALRCLDWIDRYGDIDGDGLQEYKTFTPQGYHNQSWKDSGDAVVYADGSIVGQPIATCELQGYAFDAKVRMAEILDVLGDGAGRDHLEADARRLQQRFEQTFWMDDVRTYAFALDPDKKPVRSIVSNPGHLLWSGIVADKDRASSVMARLLAPDMFSGWGIRTLSTAHPAYNPHSYQCGSVWPHDNAIIAAGARRCDLWTEANIICEGILAASSRFQNQRLPELFSGLARSPDEIPVQYLGANVPQAWAAGSIVMMLQTMLGIQADAPGKRLRLAPRLPHWIGEISIAGLRIGPAELSLRFSGNGTTSAVEIIEQSGDLDVEIG